MISPCNEAESKNVRIPANNHNHDHTGFGQIVQPPDKGKRASIVTQLRRCVSSGSGWTNRGCDIEMWIPIVILPEVDHGLRLKVWQSVVMCPKWLHTVIHLDVGYKGITTWHSYADQVQLLKSGIQWNENTIHIVPGKQDISYSVERNKIAQILSQKYIQRLKKY